MNIHFLFSSFCFSLFYFIFSLTLHHRGSVSNLRVGTGLLAGHQHAQSAHSRWRGLLGLAEQQTRPFQSLEIFLTAEHPLHNHLRDLEFRNDLHEMIWLNSVLGLWSGQFQMCTYLEIREPVLSYVHVCAWLPSKSDFFRRRRIKTRAGLSVQPGFSKNILVYALRLHFIMAKPWCQKIIYPFLAGIPQTIWFQLILAILCFGF